MLHVLKMAVVVAAVVIAVIALVALWVAAAFYGEDYGDAQ